MKAKKTVIALAALAILGALYFRTKPVRQPSQTAGVPHATPVAQADPYTYAKRPVELQRKHYEIVKGEDDPEQRAIFQKYGYDIRAMSPEGKMAIYLHSVERDYGEFLDSLNLQPETLDRVKRLLAERTIVIYDIRDIGIRDRRAGGPGLTAKDERKAQSEIDQEILALVDTRTSDKMRRMLATLDVFGAVVSNAPTIEQAGRLSQDQRLQLAEVWQEAFLANKADPQQALKVNAEGLSSIDVQTLAKTETFLTPEQQSALTDLTVYRTRSRVDADRRWAVIKQQEANHSYGQPEN
jgi:hypothetical protein